MIDFGIQMYGGMDLFRRNPDGFFAKMAEIGYRKMEPCIWLGNPGPAESEAFHFWTFEEALDFAERMKKYGLYMESFHVFGDPVGQKEELYTILERNPVRFVMQNTPDAYTADSLKEFVTNLLALQQVLEEFHSENDPDRAVQLLIHNGFHDFTKLPDGRAFFSAALEDCGGKVGMQADVGWLLYEGVEPMEYLNAYEPYVKNLHYKDMKEGFEDLPVEMVHVGLGQGVLNPAPIFAWGLERNLPQLVDQDLSHGDLIRDLADSLAILKILENRFREG